MGSAKDVPQDRQSVRSARNPKFSRKGALDHRLRTRISHLFESRIRLPNPVLELSSSMRMRRWAVLLPWLVLACSSATRDDGPGAAAAATGTPAPDGGASEDDTKKAEDTTDCVKVTDAAEIVVGTVPAGGAADEYVLTFDATSDSVTSWGEKDNEALVLEVRRGADFLAHVVLHQGNDGFTYGTHAGKLNAGDKLSLKVSSLSATRATNSAKICNAKLATAASLGNMAEGVVHAPIFHWPVQKRFDDLPVVVGWSKAGKSYQAVYSNENGGTTKQCGGGAEGIEGEISRWGRTFDIEGAFSYGGAQATWGRCTGGRPVAPGAPRMEADHPNFYYGDGHNRLYESRGGYGHDCGGGGPEKADGKIDGWSDGNPGNEPAKDAGRVVTIRPIPVDMDALGYAQFGGRREGLADVYAPWLYRLTSLEIQREGKIDNQHSLPMDQYLYVDVHAADVGGSGDRVCSPLGVGSGFVMRAKTADGAEHDGPQMTADYFGGDNAIKRIAIPLKRAYAASEIKGVTFDAYDDDGIYFLDLGDAFVIRAKGTNGATIEHVNEGKKVVNMYVDDDKSGCVNGKNSTGPVAGFGYPCAGNLYFLGL
jgi:hypothetical protein